MTANTGKKQNTISFCLLEESYYSAAGRLPTVPKRMNMNFDDGKNSPREPSGNRPPTNYSPAGNDDGEPSRVQPTRMTDFSINPSDVLCGRGKLSFNHGMFKNSCLLYQVIGCSKKCRDKNRCAHVVGTGR